ncbi:MAG: hypothetical protein HFH11_11185 [Dorea sp.]|jgi:hypothetical protein|nr:hypothetical protein [Dorea sp.]
MYKVIKRFHDLQDATKTKGGTVYFEYNVGDIFPRKGREVSEERLAELAGDDNRQGVPLIELVEEAADPGTSSEVSEAPPKKKTAKKSVKTSEG